MEDEHQLISLLRPCSLELISPAYNLWYSIFSHNKIVSAGLSMCIVCYEKYLKMEAVIQKLGWTMANNLSLGIAHKR